MPAAFRRCAPGRGRRRATSVLRSTLAASVALAAAVTSGAAAAADGPRAAGAGAQPAAVTPTTPILSVRRLPGWIAATVAEERFVTGLPAIMARLGTAARTSCLVVSQGGATIFADNPTEEVLPASNMKLLTATAVLDKLGPAARLTTRVTASVAPRGGTLHGNLYLIGAGDPLLWTPAYEAMQNPAQPLYTSLPALAARVRAAGITRITGGVIGDESLFDTQRTVPTWDPNYTEEGDVGPLSALEVNNGFRLTPPPGGAAAEPAVMAAGVFAGLLRGDGVAVAGHAGDGVSPATAVPVTSINSAPLGAVVDAILRVSDDTGAEVLTKLIGERFGGVGSTTAGVAVIRADLAADGLPVAGLRAEDGSGLDRGNRATCALMDADLRYLDTGGAGTGGALVPGLPVAASTGTLAFRMAGTAAAGRLHAKTGTLDGVSALSGFVLPAAGYRAPTPALRAPVAFSFMTNNVASGSLGVAVGDAIGVALAGPFEVPPLADALPLPAR